MLTPVAVSEDQYLSEEGLLNLPMFAHLERATLARWRSQGKGPRCTIVGRKPLYRLGEVYRWLREEEKSCERVRKVGKVALSIHVAGEAPRRRHRLGGHKTKSERREGDRSPSEA